MSNANVFDALPTKSDLQSKTVWAIVTASIIHFTGLIAAKYHWLQETQDWINSWVTQGLAFGAVQAFAWWARRNATHQLTLTGTPRPPVVLLLPLLLLPLLGSGCISPDASASLKIMDLNGKLTDANRTVVDLLNQRVLTSEQAKLYEQAALAARDSIDAATAKLQPDGTLALGDNFWLQRALDSMSRVATYVLRYQQKTKSPGSSVPASGPALWKSDLPLPEFLPVSFQTCNGSTTSTSATRAASRSGRTIWRSSSPRRSATSRS
jgi:HAMP domain-containing protein